MIPTDVQLGTISERPLSHERLQTEYSFEDSQSADTSIGAISAQISVWKETAYAFLCSFILLFVHFASGSPISTLVVPFIASDARRVYMGLISLQTAQTNSWAKTWLQSVATVSSHMAFLLLLGSYLEWRRMPLLAVGAPQYTSLCVAMLCEHFRKGECQTFSKAFRVFFMWVEASTIIFIGLKVDGIVDISWSSVLWPCWAAESLLCILTFGSLLLFIYAFWSFFLHHCDGKTVLCSLWFFWVLFGITLSFALCLYDAVKFSADKEVSVGMKISLAFPIGFLFSGLMGLHLLETRITCWCYSFFIVDFARPQQSQENLTSIAPLSNRKLSTRLVESGGLLFRVSSTFYKPATVAAEKKRPLTEVHPFTLPETPSTEEKITSVSMLQCDSIPVMPRKMCMVCCQELSNAVVMNCGHSGICSECAKEIWRHTGICHMCRERIVKVLEVETVEDSPFVKVIQETQEAEGADTS